MRNLIHLLAGTGMSCRFYPTCSEYAVQAVSVHGLFRGARLAIGRLTRCHPWGAFGYDPVVRSGELDG